MCVNWDKRTVNDLSILNNDEKLCQVWTKIADLETIDDALSIVEETLSIKIGEGLIAGGEVREKKDGNYGVFAARALKKGDVIAICKPMVCVCDNEVDDYFSRAPSLQDSTEERSDNSEDSEYEYPEHAVEVLLAAGLLTHIRVLPTDQADILVQEVIDMYPRTRKQADDLIYEPVEDKRLIKLLREEMHSVFLQKLASRTTNAAKAFYDEFSSMLFEEQIHWLLMKVACNVMACRIDSDAIDDQKRDDFYAVYHIGHFFNHSCVANMVAVHIGDLMLLRATQSVEKGTELTFSYVPIDDLRDPMDIRNFPLFDCICERCNNEPEPERPTEVNDEFTAGFLKNILGGIDDDLMNKVTAVLKSMTHLKVSFAEPFHTLASVACLPTKMPEKIDCLEALSLLWSALKQNRNSLWAILLALFILVNQKEREEIRMKFTDDCGLFAFVESKLPPSNYELAIDDTLIPFLIHLAGVLLRLRPEDTETVLWALNGAYDQHVVCYGGGLKLFELRQKQQISHFYPGLENLIPSLENPKKILS